VDFFGIVRNGKSLRLDDVVMVGKELALGVMKLPSDLDKARPIVQVLHRRIVIPR
jgi:hypothetical protein